MKKWKTYIRPVKGTFFVAECEAETPDEAKKKFWEMHPQAFRIDQPFEAC